ncbi:MAG TPA: tellurite resistance TerB family protein [Microvirga sp.]|jgi:uncharacterized membrane protein YebE (DUF533 family)
MIDSKKLLDALIGAAAQIGQPAGQQPSGQPSAGQPGQGAPMVPGASGSPVDLPPQVNKVVQSVTGQTPDQLMEKARGMLAQNPGLVQAAAVGLAGLIFGRSKRTKRAMPGGLARLGGLAVIGGLAYKAYQNSRAGKPLVDVKPVASPAGAGGTGQPSGAAQGGMGSQVSGMAQGGAAAPMPALGMADAPAGAGGGGDDTFRALSVPEGSKFHPVSQTEDDALLYLRTMVAAASADGQVDAAERGRILQGLNEAGIDPEATRWLERELGAPADVEELAAGVTSQEKAAQVYAAARIAIDPDTIQEREFLRQLAEALDLDQALRAQIDETAAGLSA